MKYVLRSLVCASIASAGTIVDAWGQCGGYGYTGAYQCEPGFTCSPLNPASTSNSFPEYLCVPNPGTVAPPYTNYVQEWGQCGGIGFPGPTVCQPPLVCTVDNDYFSQCFVDPNNPPPPPPPVPTNPTPNFADPGSYCGDLAVAFSDEGHPSPTDCLPGYHCQIVDIGDIYYTYSVCLVDSSTSSVAATSTTHASTTTHVASTTPASTTTHVASTTPVSSTGHASSTSHVSSTTHTPSTTPTKTSKTSTTKAHTSKGW